MGEQVVFYEDHLVRVPYSVKTVGGEALMRAELLGVLEDEVADAHAVAAL